MSKIDEILEPRIIPPVLLNDKEAKTYKEIKAELLQLVLEVIGEDARILVRPDPIQGIDQLWLDGRAIGDVTGKNELRAEQRQKAYELFGKEQK